jgi:hypothetical protein
MAPMERFIFWAISRGFIPEVTSLRSISSSVSVHGRPAGRGPVIFPPPFGRSKDPTGPPSGIVAVLSACRARICLRCRKAGRQRSALEPRLLVEVAGGREPSACYDAWIRIDKFSGIKGVEGNTLVSGVIMPERSSNRQGCSKPQFPVGLAFVRRRYQVGHPRNFLVCQIGGTMHVGLAFNDRPLPFV